MKRTAFILLVIIVFSTMTACATKNYEYQFMGINSDHFEDLNWKVITVGVISSLTVHELGHLLYAHNHGGGSFDWDERVVIMKPDNQSDSEQQMFHRAGFLAQLFVGGLLTAIPYTRHSDFTLGFNSFTAINTAVYTATGGLGKSGDEDRSDIHQLDNGRAEGTVYTAGAGILTYINLKGRRTP